MTRWIKNSCLSTLSLYTLLVIFLSHPMLDFLVSEDIALLNHLRSFIDPTSVLQVKLIHLGSDLEVILVMIVLVGLWLYGVYKKDDQSKIDALMMLYSIGFAFTIYVVLNL